MMDRDLFEDTPDERPPRPPWYTDQSGWHRADGYIGEPVGTELQVRFTCPECGSEALTEEFYVPGLNLMAEKARDLGVSEDFEAYCDKCGTTYELYVVSDIGGAEIYTNGWDTEAVDLEYRVVTESRPYDDVYDDYIEAVSANTRFSKTFHDGIRHVRSLATLIHTIDGEESGSLARMLYANVITLVETFLSDALIQTVMQDEDLVRRAVENIPRFKEQTFPLSAIYAKMASIREAVKRYLAGLLYHNIKKVRALYRDVLHVTLPDSADLEDAINNRHHIVHRNGRNEAGEPVAVAFNEVMNLVDLCERFVNEVDKQLPAAPSPGSQPGNTED